jgi:hypothetical protein
METGRGREAGMRVAAAVASEATTARSAAKCNIERDVDR